MVFAKNSFKFFEPISVLTLLSKKSDFSLNILMTFLLKWKY